MNGTMVGNLEQPEPLRLVERADQFDRFLDAVDHRAGLLAVGAVPAVNALLAKSYHDLLQRPFLSRGIEMDRHRCAAAERHEQ